MSEPAPTVPLYRNPPPNATWAERFYYMGLNYLNHPSLLSAIPTGELWSSEPNKTENVFLGFSTNHVSQTILITDPACFEIFQGTGVDRLPNFHHVSFSIWSRIMDRPAGRSYELVLTAQAFDSSFEPLLRSEGGYPGDLKYEVGGWTGMTILQRLLMERKPILPILKDIFADWRCIVEYFKYMANRSHRELHPLIHMHILGDGGSFRRATLRIYGSVRTGPGVPGGRQDNRRWQELRLGRWEDI